jgi:hypothetical protein
MPWACSGYRTANIDKLHTQLVAYGAPIWLAPTSKGLREMICEDLDGNVLLITAMWGTQPRPGLDVHTCPSCSPSSMEAGVGHPCWLLWIIPREYMEAGVGHPCWLLWIIPREYMEAGVRHPCWFLRIILRE